MPVPKRSEFPDFQATIEDFKRLKGAFLLYAGNSGVNFFQDGFTRKGFIDSSYKRWKERRKPKGKKKPRGSLMLVTGRLKNSIRIINIQQDGVLIGTDVPYAAVHNEGFDGEVSIPAHDRQLILKSKIRGSFRGIAVKQRTKTIEILGTKAKVKAHTKRLKMPKRQFMGESQLLMRRLEKNLVRSLEQLGSKNFR